MTKNVTSQAHTAGPWELAGWNGICNSQGEAIATVPHVRGHSSITQDEAKANARLIAAAPDLLEACKAALTEGDDYVAMEKIKAAIRKAEQA